MVKPQNTETRLHEFKDFCSLKWITKIFIRNSHGLTRIITNFSLAPAELCEPLVHPYRVWGQLNLISFVNHLRN